MYKIQQILNSSNNGQDGCVINGNTLEDCIGINGIVTVPEGVETISRGAFARIFPWGYSKVEKIILPDSVKRIEVERFGHGVDMNIPAGYLQQKEKMPVKALVSLLDGPWAKKADIKDYAALYLFQGGAQILKTCKPKLEDDPDMTCKMFAELLSLESSSALFKKAAEFALENIAKVNAETLKSLHDLAKEAKANTVAKALAPCISGNKPLTSSDLSEDSGGLSIQEMIEAFCASTFMAPVFQSFLQKRKIKEKWFESVKYKGSDIIASTFVVECALVPYMQQLKEIPGHISGYARDYVRFTIDPDADKVAAALDPESFGEMLDHLIGFDMPSAYHVLVPYGRYATGAQISTLVARMNKWKNWGAYSATGRKSIIIGRGAILLNDSREAMLYADKAGNLDYYAKLRKMDADVIRDNAMADFGLDENGKKTFDLGNTTIDVAVDRELKLTLYDTKADKYVKSIPKRGADPEKYEQAKADFADMKKNLKAIVKNRKDLLFRQFLTGEKRKAESWKSSYLHNYILHKVGELVVWEQKGRTFILTESGVVDCYGDAFEINDKDPVKVAHPMEMKAGEQKAWQQYFASQCLKQPFEQVWEPAIRMDAVRHDRYKGQMIPYYKFLRKEAEGIEVCDRNYHNEISFYFADIAANVARIDFDRHSISMEDRFEVRDVKVKRASRVANHILAFLDRETTIGRVAEDDLSVTEMLDDYSLAQIMDFIRVANENQANNVLAALLAYKNDRFVDFDPMDAFVLD